MSDFKYHDKQEIEDRKKLKNLKQGLPMFMADFFRAIDTRTTLKTQIAYAYDSLTFFNYIQSHNPIFREIPIREFPLTLLEDLAITDLEEYVEYLTYVDEGEQLEKRYGERGLNRKISSLKSMYTYFFKNRSIKSNTAELISSPKIREKEIIRLEPNETAELLDFIEAGNGSTKKQTEYRKKTKVRDLALLTLFLGTGIRVSECVGLDIEHIDFKNNAIRILRKGGKEATVYFGVEVEKALKDYLQERKNIETLPGHEKAFFLSTRRKRIAVRTVEVLVSSYAAAVTPLKKITPHKLRSTYGTTLYQETGDIRLVADVLGHSDVNTTRKHYSAQSELSRRSAGNKIKLREK